MSVENVLMEVIRELLTRGTVFPEQYRKNVQGDTSPRVLGSVAITLGASPPPAWAVGSCSSGGSITITRNRVIEYFDFFTQKIT